MDFFFERKKFFSILGIIIIILLLVSSAMFVFFPTTAKNVFSYVTLPIQSGVSNVVDFLSKTNVNLAAENEELKIEIEQLKLDNNRVEQLAADNLELTDLLGTKQKFSQYTTIAARKIGQDFNNWGNTIIIDKGAKDGIKVDMIVIAQGALVGKVVSTTPYTANITTILDDSSSVSVVSTRSDDIAFLNGEISLVGTNTCSLEYLDSATAIFVNDELFTSSISSLYPPGISVGFVTEINTDSNNEKSAIVKPIVDFDNLNTVLVIDQVFSEVQAVNVLNETVEASETTETTDAAETPESEE